jgi:hypothetical protein
VRLEYLLFRAYRCYFGCCFLILSNLLLVLLNQDRSLDDELGLLLQIRSSAWLEHYTDNVGVTSSNLVGSTLSFKNTTGGLAQLARASALHAEGHRFDSDILHQKRRRRERRKERERETVERVDLLVYQFFYY